MLSQHVQHSLHGCLYGVHGALNGNQWLNPLSLQYLSAAQGCAAERYCNESGDWLNGI
jgi:hypothetical protein